VTALFFVVLVIVLLTISSLTGVIVSALWWALVGLVVGLLARAMVKDSDGLGIFRTIFGGIAGALGGGLISRAFDVDSWIIQFLIALLVAAIVIAVASAGRSRRR